MSTSKPRKQINSKFNLATVTANENYETKPKLTDEGDQKYTTHSV